MAPTPHTAATERRLQATGARVRVTPPTDGQQARIVQSDGIRELHEVVWKNKIKKLCRTKTARDGSRRGLACRQSDNELVQLLVTSLSAENQGVEVNAAVCSLSATWLCCFLLAASRDGWLHLVPRVRSLCAPPGQPRAALTPALLGARRGLLHGDEYFRHRHSAAPRVGCRRGLSVRSAKKRSRGARVLTPRGQVYRPNVEGRPVAPAVQR